MILEIIRIVLGLVVIIFLPGYLLSLILFERLSLLERICLAVGLSISIVVLLGFFLTLVSNLTGTKAIGLLGVWVSLIAVCLFLAIILFILRTQHKKIAKTYQGGG